MASASRHVQPYAPEFRAEAIRLARNSGKSHRQIADDLGITSETLRQWLKQADLNDGQRIDGLTRDEQEELRRRRENRILREEREILKRLGRQSRLEDRLFSVCQVGVRVAAVARLRQPRGRAPR